MKKINEMSPDENKYKCATLSGPDSTTFIKITNLTREHQMLFSFSPMYSVFFIIRTASLISNSYF